MGTYAWPDTGIWETGDSPWKPCIPVQQAEVSVNLSTSKLQLRKALDIQDTGKSIDPAVTRSHIEYQVDWKDHKFLESKTTKNVQITVNLICE